MAKDKEGHWKTRPVLIKFEHLNPAAQDIIGSGIAGMNLNATMFHTIRGSRMVRLLSEGQLLNLWALMGAITMHRRQLQPSEFEKAVGGAVAASTPIAALRTVLAKVIQKKHKALVESLKESGLVQPKFEKNYPRDWINPTIVANTHPIFYVKANGDLVLLRNNRWEYARYAFQESFPGKIGLNPWMWRAYLEQPEAPQTIRAWAREQAAKWTGALVPRRKPAFGTTAAIRKPLARRKPVKKPI